MFNEIDPRLSPYYVGAFALDVLRKSSKLDINSWYEKTVIQMEFTISYVLFEMAVAWLFMINQVSEEVGDYFYVSN